MRTPLEKLALVCCCSLLAACQLDITGLDSFDWSWDGGGADWGGYGPSLDLRGHVSVGEYPAFSGEVTVYLYAPQDTLTPVDSAGTGWDGSYERVWSAEDGPDVCDWLGRAVLWSGERGALTPLFDGQRHVCDPDHIYQSAAELSVEYEPLTSAFGLTGRILSDDEPAQLEVSIPVAVMNPLDDSEPSEVVVTSEADGLYRVETTDPHQRYLWCQDVVADLISPPSSTPVFAQLWRVADPAACGPERHFPDIRLGTIKAVTGHVDIVVNFSLGIYRPADEGEGTVRLLDPADSTAVLGPVETLDDGSFHLWWSAEVSHEGFPGCDWLLEVELSDGRSTVEPLLRDGENCRPELDRWVAFR